MDNEATLTNSSTVAFGSVADAVSSTERTLQSRELVVATTTRAGQAKSSGRKGKKPARNASGGGLRDAGTLPTSAGLRSDLASRSRSLDRDFPTVAHPIFTVSAAPKVEDISHEAHTRWVDLRLEYEEIMRARCESSGEDLKSVMRSIRNSFDDSFLETLCETKCDNRK